MAQCQRVELLGQREDDVEVRHRQQLGAALLQPALLVQTLTLRAMPVATGVIDDLARSTAGALVDVPAESSGAAVLDGSQGPQLGPVQMAAERLSEGRAEATDDVSHLQATGGGQSRLPLRAWIFLCGIQPIERTDHFGES